MTETITVNGLSLATHSVMLTDTSGLMRAPSRRGENIQVPGRHGRIPTKGKRYEQGELVLSLWIDGCLPDGTVPGGSNALHQFEQRRDEILRAFHADTVIVDYTPDSGVTRRALCEVVDVMDFSRARLQPTASVSVALTIPGAFWSDIDPRTESFTVATGGAAVLTGFAAATAPMDELTVEFGSGNNPELSQGPVFLAYDAVIPPGQGLVVDTKMWTLAGVGGLVPDYSKVRHGGSPRFFELSPESPAPSVNLTHTGGGSMSCSISGPRRFLTG